MAGLIGRKIGMSRVFDDQGRSHPVTVIHAGPCAVTQIKRKDTDGYDAVQLGFEEKKAKRTSKAETGHLAKAGLTPKRILREFDGFDMDAMKLGDEVTVAMFSEGETVEITGWSKGKGFQGVVKRHGFSGGPKTHGQSDRLRAPGSLGQSSYPSRVFKGIRMGGRTGGERVTVKKRRVIKVFPEKNMVLLQGSVPGSVKSLILLKK
jgi:large subunit ribosomal protein L3